jgi:predicted acyltransferase
MQNNTDRLVSLDFFRGLTIAGMILVNNAGNWNFIYPALGHAPWHGITPTDLIFPFFLFIVGVAMTLSFTKRLERGIAKKRLFLHVIYRSVIIFILGLFLNGFPYFDMSILRIPGVLQRIAIVYFLSSVIFLTFNKKFILYWIIGLLSFYWLMMAFFPVPGFGAGILTKEGNFSAYIDRMFLMGHMYTGTRTWDPEGIFSTLPAIATTLFGIMAAFNLQSNRTKEEKTILLFFWGCILSVLGVIMDIYLPINKNIWTSSYSVYTAGMALLFLAMSYYLIDIKGYKKWTTPFLVFGTNAITVYFLSGIIARILNTIKISDFNGIQVTLKTWIYNNAFAWLGTYNASLGYAVCYVLFWLGIMWIFYSKKLFIKV